MKNKKLILGTTLAMLMSLTTMTPAFAAETDVMIDAKATTVNMTVPATAPMVFNADGTNTVPTNFTIQNNSKIGGVHLSNIELNADTQNSWKIAKEGTDLKVKPANTKTITLKLGASGVEKFAVPSKSAEESANATVTFGPTDFTIPASGNKTLSFIVDRGAFTNAIPNAKAFDMTLNFDFN